MTEEHRDLNPSTGPLSADLNSLCIACFSPGRGEDVCPACGYSESKSTDGDWNRLKPGTIVHGRYVVGRLIGQGGFGMTYLGMDLLLKTKLAIKEYFPTGLAIRNPEDRSVTHASEEIREDFVKGMEKFIEEARTLARFEGNPCIVSVKDFFEENGSAYMVMTLLEGRTLMAHIKERGGRLSFGEAFAILSPLMDALDEVHASGLIHRDISPDNIFLTRFGQIKLLDFGASKTVLSLIQQRHHSVILKKGYSPPEQYRGSRRLGPWSDVYGMAATFYRCIAGMVPADALDRLEEDVLPSPISMGISIPGYAEAALMRALSLASEDRPQSMRELKEGLLGDVRFSSYDAKATPRAPERPESERADAHAASRRKQKKPARPRGRIRRFVTWLFFFLSLALLAGGGFLFFAARDLMERAEGGDPSAQRSVGRLYEFGGLFGSREKAAEWYMKAARQGDAAAQYALGRMSSSGTLGPPDPSRAADWYEKAAEEGYVHAQHSLALAYESGRGRKQDYAQAAKWYRRAAEQGDVRAQFSLGSLYEQGLGFKPSETQAADWYQRAGEQGHTEAQLILARMYEQGKGVSRSERAAAFWYGRAAASGSAHAQFVLGDMYDTGRGVDPDPVQAAKWYKKAAGQGHPEAQTALGRIYTGGTGVSRDDAKGAAWYRKAAEQGEISAQFGLGFCYEFGRGVPKDIDRAADWYGRAAAGGHALANVALERLSDKMKRGE
ncbi:MAG: protein kinase [Synergistaceae bacterium]|nr:protein kinase [Synergistaceae bacterium]